MGFSNVSNIKANYRLQYMLQTNLKAVESAHYVKKKY